MKLRAVCFHFIPHLAAFILSGVGVTEQEEKGSGQPQLTAEERKQVERRSSPRTEVVYEAIREEGENELGRSSPTLARPSHASAEDERLSSFSPSSRIAS